MIQNSQIQCQKCLQMILSQNYFLHQLRCNGIKQVFQFKTSVPNSLVKEQKINEEIQLFTCSYCGFSDKLYELQNHKKQCIAKIVKCSNCDVEIPEQLMNEHNQVCQKRINKNINDSFQQNNNQNEQIRSEYSDQNQAYYYPDKTLIQSNQYRNGKRILIKSKYLLPSGQIIQQINYKIIPDRFQNQDFIQRFQGNHRLLNSFPFSLRIQRNWSNFDNFFQQIMDRRMNILQNYNRRQFINPIKKIKYNNNSNFSQDCCSICYNKFKQGQNLVQLPCKHLFQYECLQLWFQENKNCPICKSSINM